MVDDIVKKAKDKMEKTCALLKKDLQSLRAGRANPQILDKVLVPYYGSPTPLKQLANVSVPEARVLQISLYDTKALGDVEKAILKSDIGINPTNDGKVIRLVIPELNEERRKELSKQVRKSGEESKVAVRSVRRDAIEQMKKAEKSSEITEDDLKNGEERMQKLTDTMGKEIDQIVQEKEKEIMSV